MNDDPGAAVLAELLAASEREREEERIAEKAERSAFEAKIDTLAGMLNRIESEFNGKIAALTAEVAALTAEVAGLKKAAQAMMPVAGKARETKARKFGFTVLARDGAGDIKESEIEIR